MNLDFAVIGKTTDTKNIELIFDNKKVAEIPIDLLAENAPIYDRKWKKTKLPQKLKFKKDEFKALKLGDCLNKILSNPNISDKRWIWDQYDHTVMGDTIQKPGGDAGVVRVHGTKKAVAASVDSSASYCYSHPLTGGKQIVCESWRNLISVGAKPIAITNCLNFGNPEKEKNMGEFVECLKGIKEACEFLDYPIVSGNVSFYNGTNKKNIHPTPVIGGVGIIKDIKNKMNLRLKKENNIILQIGKSFGHLSQSTLFEEVYSIFDGPPPDVNLLNEKNNGLAILKLINENLISSVHDISSGGLILALAEMSMSSDLGVKINKPQSLINLMEYFFGEDQGRYIIELEPNQLEKVKKILEDNNIHNETVGTVQKEMFEIPGELKIKVNELQKLNNQWYNNY